MKEISLRPADRGFVVSPKSVKGARRLSAVKRQLTTREKEILRFLALGMGTSSIARELSISPATVRNHAQRILAKLQVHSRLAAVARGYAVGLVVMPGPPAKAAPEIVGR
jgi:DNA-binding NarL/FixJ family response regulator